MAPLDHRMPLLIELTVPPAVRGFCDRRPFLLKTPARLRETAAQRVPNNIFR
jgi:hypothetical protein